MDSNIKKGERSEKVEKVGGKKEGEVWGEEEKWQKMEGGKYDCWQVSFYHLPSILK